MVRLIVPISRPKGFYSEVASSAQEIKQLAIIEIGYVGTLEEIGFVDTSELHPDFLLEVFLELGADAVLANPLEDEIILSMIESGVIALEGECKTLKDFISAYLSGRLVPLIPWSDYGLERPPN